MTVMSGSMAAGRHSAGVRTYILIRKLEVYSCSEASSGFPWTMLRCPGLKLRQFIVGNGTDSFNSAEVVPGPMLALVQEVAVSTLTGTHCLLTDTEEL